MFYKIILSITILIFVYSPNYISFAQDDHDHDHEVAKDSTVQTIDSVKSVNDDTVQPKKPDEIVKEVTVPTGTKFIISINTPLASNRNVAGSTFSATLNADLVVDTIIVSPKNSLVIGKIIESKSSQGIGESILSIQITEITIKEQLTPVVTEPIIVKGERKRNSEAEITAGTIKEVTLTKALTVKLSD